MKSSSFLSATAGRLAALGLLLVSWTADAAPPDLTNGGVPGDTISTNLGATGMRGWVHHVRDNSSESRQILVHSVASGSPAAGILAANDVILGAGGTAADPVNFSSDARKSFADAINDAEARTPATLKLIRWRAGVTDTVEITLQTLGDYSATAPYNCPKSALILQQGLQAVMAGETAGQYSFGLLTLLAANNPSDPGNAARMARAQTEARALIPNAATRAQMMSDMRDGTSMITWQRGHTLIALTEYYLVTGDTLVLPAIEAYAVNIAKNTSLFGTVGHIFAEKFSSGAPNGPMGGVYGPVNSTGMPCFLGLLLARECGLTNPEIEPAIVRASRFFASYAGKGAVPYGEHEPYPAHESNGKSGLAALCFALEDHRASARNFYAKMATAAPTEREQGHTGAFFNYLWSPLGAAVGGEAAASLHFSRIRWMLDLNRRWDGKFDYDCLNGEGPNSGSSYNSFRMSTAALLVYALPLRQLHLTGRGHDPAGTLSAPDLADAAAADSYITTGRSNGDLIADTGNWSPKIRRNAAIQLGVNKAGVTTTQRNQLHAIAADTALPDHVRAGACDALGRIANSASATVLADLLTDSRNYVRYAAAEALRYLPNADRQSQLTKILTAAATNARPVTPFDEEDPLHFDHGRLAMLLFYGGNAYGPKGILWNNITGVNRSLLYPAIRAVAANPVGQARSTLASVYPLLTRDDTIALADAVVDTVVEYAPSDRMFASGVRQKGFELMWKYDVAEGVPAGMKYVTEANAGDRSAALGVLEQYAASYTTVTPVPDVIALATSYLNPSGGSPEQNVEIAAAAQAVLDAITADTTPQPLVAFKDITAVTADAPQINLPANTTVLRVSSYDHAQGDSRFTWRKIQGPGSVAFSNNGTAAGKDCAILIGSQPGQYLFEVTMSDSRGLTEASETVAVTLRNSDGSLPPNSPPLANSQSIPASKATPTPVTLTATDPEAYALSYAITTPPANGTLTGTAPYLVYTSALGYSGPDSFTFKVTDSGGLTSSATVTITVDPVSAIGVAIYEPFDYPAGSLGGKSGPSEIGLTGTWTANETLVSAGSFSQGDLVTTGGKISGLAGNVNRFAGARAINPAALGGNGLLNHGATLWFGAIVGFDTGGNVTNSRLAISLANSPFNSGNFDYWIVNEGAQLGSGVGLVLGGIDGVNGRVVATQFRELTAGDGTAGNVYGSWTGTGSTYAAGTQGLIVGKITWGATPADLDRIELYQPGSNLVLPANPISVLETQVNQSAFDTLTMARGDKVVCDEIRFGPSYQSLLMGTTAMAPDLAAPTPNPVQFDTPPAPSAAGAISMLAATAFDLSGVEYYFTCTSGSGSGGTDSGWQDSPAYTDTGLAPGVSYAYTVKARDKSPARNETAPSAPASVPNQAAIPDVTGLLQADAGFILTASHFSVGSVTTTSSVTVPAGRVISQTPAGSSTAASFSTVDLVLSAGSVMSTVPEVIGFAQATASSGIIAANLVVGTVTTQQHSTLPAGVVISQSPAGGTSVLTGSAVDLVVSLGDVTPPAPDPMSFAVAPQAGGSTRITMTATAATDASGVEYLFTCVAGPGHHSGWQDSPVYEDIGLLPETQYSYTVTARDKSSNLNATQPSAPAAATTPATPPSNGTWIFDGDGPWSNAAHWNAGTIADGPGSTASFTLNLTGNRTVTLDSTRTIGHLIKTDTVSSNHTLTIGGTANTLTLAAITNNDPGDARRLVISRPVAGTNGLTIAGGGVVQLTSSTSSYTGPTSILAGSLLDFGGMSNASIGGGTVAGPNISVAAGSAVRFNTLDQSLLNRIAATADEITVMSGATGNALDFSAATGTNLPNAFFGTWASNGAKMEYTGTLTPAADHYRLGGKGSSGLLGIRSTLTGTQGLIVGGTGASGIRVNLVAANTFSGDTVIRTGTKLTIGHNLALQNSALDVGAAGGTFALAAGTNAGRITGETAAASPTFGGLNGSRALLSVFTNSGGNNETNLAATAITGFTLNPGTGKSCTYSGAIANFAPATSLTKTGEGTQILDSTNSYSGPTTITRGTLALGLNGSISNSASLAIAAGATFDTAAKASHAIPAAQPVTFGIDATGSGSCGSIHAAALNIGNATVAFDIAGTPDDPAYVLATYTSLQGGTFASVPAAPAGYQLDYAYQGNRIALVKIVAAPYAAWSGGAGFESDANTDGIANGIAWVLGAADPSANATALLPLIDNSSDPDFFIFNYRRLDNAAADSRTTIRAQYGSTLAGWTDAMAGPDIIITTADDFHGPGIDKVEVKIRRTLATGGKLFTRLQVVTTP
jgi:autotransporter-associated beta strand protein